MAEVVLEHVTKEFPGVVAVDDANLIIADREFLVLVGPSGCGKTTTLRMIAGLEEITKGTIRIGERVVNDVPPKDRDIAMVFQNYALYPHMTVRNNMAFGLKLRRYPKKDIKQRVTDAAEILGIGELLDRKPKELSGGQRQRVAVGRAIVRKPSAFLFDEPLSNLDAKLRVGMRAELSKLHTKLRTTMIYVTHDQIEAMTLGDRIVLLNDGIIQQVAPPLILYNYPVNLFTAGFIGTPPMNIIQGGTLEATSGALMFVYHSMRIRVRDQLTSRLQQHVGKKVAIGIRPENMSFADENKELEEGTYVDATVEVVEPLGDEMILYLKTDDLTLISKVEADRPVKVGESVRAAVDLEKVHLFGEDDANISLPEDFSPQESSEAV